jgi:hypothetical protein
LDRVVHVTTKKGGRMSSVICKEACDYVKMIEMECFESNWLDEIVLVYD